MNGNVALKAHDISQIHAAIGEGISKEIDEKTAIRDRKLIELEELERSKSDDTSQQLATRENLSSEIRRLNARLLALREAKDRIASGVYGLCRHCKEQIPVRRLQAMPIATACVNCADEAGRPHLVHL